MTPTKSQLWARNLSRNLESSYDSSALIDHKVTSGESREYQILDILKILLPQKYSLEKNVVIIDHKSTETIKFDGALIDEDNWPKLFYDNYLKVSPIESVKIAFEIKSNLGLTEVTKIYKEAKNIAVTSLLPIEQSAKVVGFTYKCANIKLTYYDFVEGFLLSEYYPTLVAILNNGILCFLDSEGAISKNPDKSCTPIFLETKGDTLLAFLYFLTEHISENQVANVIRRYSKKFFEAINYFKFEPSFIALMRTDSATLRNYFKGELSVGIQQTYDATKKAIGL